MIGLGFLQGLVNTGNTSGDKNGDAAQMMIVLVFVAIFFIPVYYRLKNIGMNPWWCLLMLVPIANLLVGIRCLVFQEGYADTQKLDATGKVIACIVLGLFVIVIVTAYLSFRKLLF